MAVRSSTTGQVCLNATAARGVFVIRTGTYKISGDPALTVSKRISIWGNGAVLDYGTGTGTALLIGPTAPATYIDDINIEGLYIRRTYGTGPASSELLGTGIRHVNVKGGTIASVRVEGFAKGLHLLGDGDGNYYNHFVRFLLANNLVGIDIDTANGGWSNENVFTAGRILLSPAFASTAGSRSVTITPATANNHNFFGVNFEGAAAERKLVVNGASNQFVGCRWDGSNGGTDIEFGASAHSNTLFYGYDLWNMQVVDTNGSNNVYTANLFRLGGANPAVTSLGVRPAGYIASDDTALFKIEGRSRGSPSRRAMLQLASDSDYRARGLWFTSNDSNQSWFAGVGYASYGFSINRAATNPEYPQNAMFFIKTDGNVGIGKTSPIYRLDVNGSVAGTGPYVELSDERLKTNIKPIHNALDLIRSLDGIRYTAQDHPSTPQLGLRAQQVASVVPEAAQHGDDGYWRVAYSRLVPVLVEAMKEQQQQIDRQQLTIEQLKADAGRLAQPRGTAYDQ